MNFTCAVVSRRAECVWAEKLIYKGHVLVRSSSTRNAVNHAITYHWH